MMGQRIFICPESLRGKPRRPKLSVVCGLLKAVSNRQAPQYQGFDLLAGKENVESWLTPTLSSDVVFDSFPAS